MIWGYIASNQQSSRSEFGCHCIHLFIHLFWMGLVGLFVFFLWNASNKNSSHVVPVLLIFFWKLVTKPVERSCKTKKTPEPFSGLQMDPRRVHHQALSSQLNLGIIYQVLPSDLFGGFKWPLQGLSDLHLGNQKVTWKKLVVVEFVCSRMLVTSCELKKKY